MRRFFYWIKSFLEDHQYPLPIPDDIFATLNGGQFFSKIDFAEAYLQIVVDEKSKELYTYNRLPFGIKVAPAIFQQIMDTMLAGLKGVISYLDDLIVVGKTEEEHFQNLMSLMQRIEQWGFKIREEKCQFFLTQISYLGFIITREGRRPDPEKVKAIIQLPEPTEVSKLRSFIGMLNYYGQFLKEHFNPLQTTHPTTELAP